MAENEQPQPQAQARRHQRLELDLDLLREMDLQGDFDGPARGLLSRLRPVHLLAGLNILAIAACGVWAVGRLIGPAEPSGPAHEPRVPPVSASETPAAASEDAPRGLVPPAATGPVTPSATTTSDPMASVDQGGCSLAMAEKAAANHEYAKALAIYDVLLRTAEQSPSGGRLGDFLRLRSAECLMALGNTDTAHAHLSAAADSHSPAVRGMACLRLASVAGAEGRHMLARMRAYQALATVGVLPPQAQFEAECDFLAAQAASGQALSYANAVLPPARRRSQNVDLFAGLTEPDILSLLNEGVDTMAAAALAPEVKRALGPHGRLEWSAISSGAPLDEFVARVAAVSGREVFWTNVEGVPRRRPVTLAMHGVTEQELLEAACGAVGLVARFTGERTEITDPQALESTGETRDLLARGAGAAWRRFFLHHGDDERVAFGHFAVAAVLEAEGETGSAVAEFRVVAERFPRSPLAPAARLRMAEMRMALRDYAGARSELLDLLNAYPDCAESDHVYLRLGQAAMEGKRHDEALAVFKKLYYLNLTVVSAAEAALGAGRCTFRQGDANEAARWLARCIEMAPGTDAARLLPEAYTLLAQAEATRGRLTQAVDAYRQALAAAPDGPARTHTLLALAEVFTRQDDLVRALGILERMDMSDASPAQVDEVALAKAEVFRRMGLADRAAGLLRHRLDAVTSPETDRRMRLELGRCLTASGQPGEACRVLTDLLPALDAGPESHRVSLELADACLKAGRPAQAVTVCRQVLATACPDDVRGQVQTLLAQACAARQFQQAAVVAVEGAAQP
jgi:tetratricopeptide (TPR) repeat protein